MAKVKDAHREALVKMMEQAKMVRDDELAGVRMTIARAFLEVWAYLEAFRDSKEPMSYQMVEEIFGRVDRSKIEEVLKHAV